MIECIEQSTVLVFILSVLAFALNRAWRLTPPSLEQQSIWIASRYLIAYTASYGFWIFARIPPVKSFFEHWDSWPLLVSVSWRLLSLNGSFNFVALWLHARDSVRDLHQTSFHAQLLSPSHVTVVEVSKVDYERLSRRYKAELAEIQNANQRLWAELGLTYEQGVTGQMEPLSDEERATYFYSILNYSSRLQQAQVI
eukprot:CAMPEP_0179141544 /NCGR_PEP_ID=MMETSP0796-20121207/67897_1 /TAXON_ID=73915 /ORGANISM="Pyrodinium bahamense, Strain pbaha01" /LENGTH=196 /DNA_ID=CAMNT_0020841283 /DNA_START=473 /DNA_END=1063 /DNA_ORIENTATION=+